MKNCCLWINGKKVSDVQGIKDNFNITDVRGYYLGGKLPEWLRCHGAEALAYEVERISPDDDADKALHRIFTEAYVRPEYHNAQPTDCTAVTSGGASCAGSFKAYAITNSFAGICSFPEAQVKNGSFSYEYEFEFGKGSFTAGSFALGSFSAGSFSLGGSFHFGSFVLGTSFDYSALLSTSFDYSALFSSGFSYKEPLPLGNILALANITSEPLNRFGYGINLV